MNNEFAPHARLLLESEWACFRRPEFSTDYVTYPTLTPLHAQRLLARCMTDVGNWSVSKIGVYEPLFYDWLTVATNAGERRAYAVRRPRYVVTLVATATGANQRPPRMKTSAAIHLGLPMFPGRALIWSDEEAGGKTVADTRDLGWMPIALTRGDAGDVIYQHLTLFNGVIDLAFQDQKLIAR